MADNTLNSIGAARRAMEQVVGPALASAPSLVREQAQLVAATLRLLEEQLPYARDHRIYELRANLELARRVRDLAPGDLAADFDAEVTSAEQLLVALGPRDRELESATASLAEVTSALVRSSEALPADQRAELIREVVLHAGAVIEGQRSWFASQGWGGSGTVRPMPELYAVPDGSDHDHRS